ncbi:heavy-metal-associated domain-containing protein [Kerstersia similis]|uniref:heavy-metal-associated domain-containing protein n=1 Tax=Kerstersia similis TaxID=206505 RepID=UPI0039EE0CC7
MATLQFQVPDMSCDHCVRALTGAIQEAVPGALVQADLTAHTLTVTGTEDIAAVERGIAAADYEFTRKEA